MVYKNKYVYVCMHRTAHTFTSSLNKIMILIFRICYPENSQQGVVGDSGVHAQTNGQPPHARSGAVLCVARGARHPTPTALCGAHACDHRIVLQLLATRCGGGESTQLHIYFLCCKY